MISPPTIGSLFFRGKVDFYGFRFGKYCFA